MKIINKTQRSSVLLFCISSVLLFFLLFSCKGGATVKTEYIAYQLRINGNADSAKVLLDKALATDSTNSAAWFELARTKLHIGLGNPRELMSIIPVVQQCAQNAADNAPDNVIYKYFLGNISFLSLYADLQMGKKDVAKSFAKAVESYESVLAIKPDYHQAKLYLVELFTMIPRDMEGDSIRAEKYVLELESADIVLGAKARDLILPDDADRVEFWKKILKNNQNKTGINEALGKAYLYEDNVKEAKKCFENEIRLDPNKNILYVDIGRYYIMQAMQNRNKIDSLSTYAIDAFEVYLNSKPEPINSMKAFAIGNQAMIKFQTGDKEGGKVLQEKAKSYDPNYSKAFGTPSKLLFDLPDKVSDAHSYFSRPF